MKKIILPGLLMFVIIGFTACKKSPEKMLVGKWKLFEISMPTAIDEAAKKDLFEKVTFTFMENKNYDIVGLKEGGTQGTWEISEDGKSITSKSSDGEVDISTITEISEEKLMMTQGDTKMGFKKIE